LSCDDAPSTARPPQFNELVKSLVKTETGKAEMNVTIAYCRPEITILGAVIEMVQDTLIKGHRGIIEAIHWRILPAYDLDD
jgi:hypothetical protein